MNYMKVIILLLLTVSFTAFSAANDSGVKNGNTNSSATNKKNEAQSNDKEKELVLVKMLVKPRKCHSWPECD